jgi:hypothetical protein
MGNKQKKANAAAINAQTAALQAQTRAAARQAKQDRRTAIRSSRIDAAADRQLGQQIRDSEAQNAALLASLDEATPVTEYIDDTSQSRRRRMAGGSAYGFRRMTGGGLGGPNGTLG